MGIELPQELTTEAWSASGYYLYLSTPGERAAYSHAYYLGLRYGHGEPQKLSAYIIKSARKLTPFDMVLLKQYLGNFVLQKQPMEVLMFSPLPDGAEGNR